MFQLKECIFWTKVAHRIQTFWTFHRFLKPGVSFCINFAPSCNFLAETQLKSLVKRSPSKGIEGSFTPNTYRGATPETNLQQPQCASFPRIRAITKQIKDIQSSGNETKQSFQNSFCYQKTVKKKTGFLWNFLETPIQSVQRCLNPLFQRTLFLMFLLFQKYLNPQVRTNKMINSIYFLYNSLLPLLCNMIISH